MLDSVIMCDEGINADAKVNDEAESYNAKRKIIIFYLHFCKLLYHFC